MSFRHLLLVLQLCKFFDSGTSGRCRGREAGHMGRQGMGHRGRQLWCLKHDFLFCEAQLLAITQGKTVVVAKEGDSVMLPCEGSQKAYFAWKLPDQRVILGNQKLKYILTKGRIPCTQSRWGKETVS